LKEIILQSNKDNKEKKQWLLVEKIYQMIQKKRMKDVDKSELYLQIQEQQKDFNLYRFINLFKKEK
jgi:LAO/AO transport system kinase